MLGTIHEQWKIILFRQFIRLLHQWFLSLMESKKKNAGHLTDEIAFLTAFSFITEMHSKFFQSTEKELKKVHLIKDLKYGMK